MTSLVRLQQLHGFDAEGEWALENDELEEIVAALPVLLRIAQAAQRFGNLPMPVSSDERVEWMTAQGQLREALGALEDDSQGKTSGAPPALSGTEVQDSPDAWGDGCTCQWIHPRLGMRITDAACPVHGDEAGQA